MKRHPALVSLSRQHHDGLALGVFIERGLRDGADPAVAESLRGQVLDAWELELRGHFEVEERILFPAVREAIPVPETIDILIGEHVEIRTAIESLETAQGEALVDELLAWRQRLVRHIRTEERVLFEAVQASLSEEEMVSLGERIDKELPAVCVRLGSASV
ncbi:MAG: hemerythrin domain-containing protein [Bryobacterales bacterium]|nr:hemerythrin domain-containing protein [Bryobacterales bacterium]